MNILHLNTYLYKDNLSFPPYQIHKEILSEGHDSRLLVAKGDVNEEGVICLNRGGILPTFELSRVVRKVFFEIILRNKYNYFYPEWNLDSITSKQVLKRAGFIPDIIITYWSKFAFNQKLVYELSEKLNVPVMCILMDMAPLTGGCHYAYDCNRYENECGMCPAINSHKQNDLSHSTWKFKKKYIEKTDITLIVASATLKDQVERSSLHKGKKIRTLILSIDEDVYKPIDKDYAKRLLGINEEKKVIFYGAASLKNKRKGLEYFIKSLDILYNKKDKSFKNEDVFILFAGNDLEQIEIPFDYKHIGYLKTQSDLALAYQACDLFACSSIEDSGPIMINQSIMSGRPVVSFNVGVAPDLVHSGQTGYRAELKNCEDFAGGLSFVLGLDNDSWIALSDNCRSFGLQVFSKESHKKNLLKFIEEAIMSHKKEFTSDEVNE